MIKTRADLIEYIAADNAWYQPKHFKTRLIDAITSSTPKALKRYLILLRKNEYHLNNSPGSRLHTYLSWYYEGKKNRLGQRLGIEIPPNCFGKGLQLWHAGGVVVNPNARIGEECVLHGAVCIGNKGNLDLNPVIGDHVDIGYGAVIVGNISVADNTIIGANAFVNKSVLEPGQVIAGVPARRIQSRPDRIGENS